MFSKKITDFLGEKRFMYGYLRWKNKESGKDKLTNTYKCYYCGLCSAMKKNYGVHTLIFLSNDITLLLLVIMKNVNQNMLRPQCCLGIKREKIDGKYSEEQWKHVAVVTLSIAYAKVLDNYWDERDFKSGILFYIVRIMLRKVRVENSKLFHLVEKEMYHIKKSEDSYENLEKQSALMSKLLQEALMYKKIICMSQNEKQYIDAIARWLCFVDAIDDYENDRKKRSYNPLFINDDNLGKGIKWEKVESKERFLEKHYKQIACIYNGIMEKFYKTLSCLDCNSNEYEILYKMIYEQMPKIFIKALRRR